MKYNTVLSRIIICVIFIVTFIFTSKIYYMHALASEGQNKQIISEYFKSVGSDWEHCGDLVVEQLKPDFARYAKECEKSHDGLLNVISAEIIDIIEVDYEDVEDSLSYYDCDDGDRFYIVGINYEVYEDSIFFSNGIMYSVIPLKKENGEMRIAAYRQLAHPEKNVSKVGVNNEPYLTYIEMMNLREEGYFVNSNFELYMDVEGKQYENIDYYDYIDKKIKDEKQNGKLTTNATSATTPHLIPTDSSYIYYGLYTSGGVYMYKQNLFFHSYCLGVSAGEVRGVEFDGEARKAVDIAIKTFSWHYYILPIDPNNGVNIKNTMQSYRYDKVSENNRVTTDYNAVKNIWIESYGGAIFEAHYYLGSYSSNGGNGGSLYQEGCRYLVNECGYTFNQCVRYYYDNSTASQGGGVRFFDQNKNVLSSY